jgi:hypothetical protein
MYDAEKEGRWEVEGGRWKVEDGVGLSEENDKPRG